MKENFGKHGLFDEMTEQHVCDEPDCLLGGMTRREISHLGFALGMVQYCPDLLETTVFKDPSTGQLYAMLTVDKDGARAIVGILYMPGMLDTLAAYTQFQNGSDTNDVN